MQPNIAQLKQAFPEILDIVTPPKPTQNTGATGLSQKDVGAKDVSPQNAESTENTEPTDLSPPPQVVLLRDWRPRKNAKILATLVAYGWGTTEKTAAQPLLLSEAEYRQWQPFAWELHRTSVAILESIQRQTHDVYQAQSHLLSALDNIAHTLQLIRQEPPQTGIHAYCVAKNLELIFQHLLTWTFALHQRVYREDAESTEFLQTLCRKDGLFPPALLHLQLQLQAFSQRQQIISTLAPGLYGHCDQELGSFLALLQGAVESVRKLALERYSVPAVEVRRKKLHRGFGIAAAVIVMLGIIAGFLYYRFSLLQPISPFPHIAKKGAIKGAYYRGANFEKFVRHYTNTTIGMRWVAKPASDLPADFFSARWDGYLEAPKSGSFRICVEYDDGMRIWIGGKQLLSDWRGGHFRTLCATARLRKGWHPLKLEFFENSGPASIYLKWRTPGSRTLQIVPSLHLCCK